MIQEVVIFLMEVLLKNIYRRIIHIYQIVTCCIQTPVWYKDYKTIKDKFFPPGYRTQFLLGDNQKHSCLPLAVIQLSP